MPEYYRIIGRTKAGKSKKKIEGIADAGVNLDAGKMKNMHSHLNTVIILVLDA